MSYKSKKLRNSARLAPCLLRSPDCNCNIETTVLCHDNSISSGKGMGVKAHDYFAFLGCSDCHFNENKYKELIPFAIKDTWLFWIRRGYLQVTDKDAFEKVINEIDWIDCKNKFQELWDKGVIYEP